MSDLRYDYLEEEYEKMKARYAQACRAIEVLEDIGDQVSAKLKHHESIHDAACKRIEELKTALRGACAIIGTNEAAFLYSEDIATWRLLIEGVRQ